MFITEETESNQDKYKEIVFPNLLQLSSDLKAIFDQQLLCDIGLSVNGKNIKGHKDILSIRSKWFSMKIRQASSSNVNIIKINERSHILDAVLVYIYTGNLKLLETLNISLVDLRNASDKYGLSSLKKILSEMIKSESSLDKTKSIEFTWSSKVDCCSSFICNCAALENFSLHGSDKWGVELEPLFLRDGTSIIGIYLKRETLNETQKIVHIVNVSVHLVDSNGAKHLSFKGELAVIEDSRYRIGDFAPEDDAFKNIGVFDKDRKLTLAFELTVRGKLGGLEHFQIKGRYQRCISNELLNLSHDMYQMLKMGKYSDISIQLKGSLLLKAHSYVILGRSKIPISALCLVGDSVRFGSVVLRSFVFFSYTGQTCYLDDHMRIIYSVLSDLKLSESIQKYSKTLADNLNVNNAFDILCDAIRNGDSSLVNRASQFLACSSQVLSDSQVWIKIASDRSTKDLIKNRLS